MIFKIKGHVVEKESGKGLPGLIVKAYDWSRGSSRAQARATLGREFPNHALFRYVRRVPSSTIIHVSCTLSKIPDIGFSPVRLQK